MRAGVGVAIVLVLAGCGDEPSPDEQAQSDARDVAMVEAANNVMPPLEQVTPEPILLPDIERFDLYGEAVGSLADNGTLYTLVAAGLVVFGLFSLLLARYRIVPDLDRADLRPRLH